MHRIRVALLVDISHRPIERNQLVLTLETHLITANNFAEQRYCDDNQLAQLLATIRIVDDDILEVCPDAARMNEFTFND